MFYCSQHNYTSKVNADLKDASYICFYSWRVSLCTFSAFIPPAFIQPCFSTVRVNMTKSKLANGGEAWIYELTFLWGGVLLLSNRINKMYFLFTRGKKCFLFCQRDEKTRVVLSVSSEMWRELNISAGKISRVGKKLGKDKFLVFVLAQK